VKLFETKISVKVSKEDWDKLDDAAMEEINDLIDVQIAGAIDRVVELMEDIGVEKGVTLKVFSD
jgi:hypothetical protein